MVFDISSLHTSNYLITKLDWSKMNTYLSVQPSLKTLFFDNFSLLETDILIHLKVHCGEVSSDYDKRHMLTDFHDNSGSQ